VELHRVIPDQQRFLSRDVKLCLALALGVILFELYGLGSDKVQAVVGWSCTSLLYANMTWRAWRRIARPFERGSAQLKFWRRVTFSVGSRGVGDASMVVATLMSRGHPGVTTGVGLVLYVAGMAVASFALLAYPMSAPTPADRKRTMMDLSIVIVSSMAFGWVFVISPNVTNGVGQMRMFASIALVSVLLVTAYALAKLLLSTERPVTPLAGWWTIPSLCAFSTAEGLSLVLVGTQHVHWVFVARVVGGLSHVLCARAQEWETAVRPDISAPTRRRPYSIVPYVFMGTLYGLLAFVLARSEAEVTAWGVLLTVSVCTVLLVARQLSAFSENAELLEQLSDSYLREFESNRARAGLEVQLRHAQKLDALGRLAGGVAHELNTPLQAVRSNLEFLSESVPSLLEEDRESTTEERSFMRAEVPQAIAEATASLGRATQIVRSLQVVAGDAGPGRASEGPVEVNALLDDSLVVVRHEISQVADLQLDLGDLPLVRCSGVDLGQVLLELLRNAAQAIPSDGGRGVIAVRTMREDDAVEVRIADTGTGIAPAVVDRVYDPFFTTKAVGGGAGQGLAVARSVIEGVGGTIDFETEVGVGTTFIVRIPAITGPVAAPVEAGTPAVAITPS
jgi:signal transduction histidine kinase